MKEIVYRGTLTKAKLKELSEQYFGVKIDTQYDPKQNPKAISIIQQEDGNWMGWASKWGTIVSVREVKPEDCLTKLITHG